jgi:hypothetical protein
MICLLDSVRESDDRVRVNIIHYKPERLTAAQRGSGIMVDKVEADLPQPEDRARETPVLYFNPNTQAFWYEYMPRPATQEELLVETIEKLNAVATKLDDLVGKLGSRQVL